LLVRSAGITDVGLKRVRNEDVYSIEEALGLYLVADGMGGHQAGGVASNIAAKIVSQAYKKWLEEGAHPEEIFGAQDPSLSVQGNYVLGSIRLANRIIYEMANQYEQYRGMGTTIALLVVTPAIVIAGNVGDSRIYLIRDGQSEKLSKDHTVVSEQVEMGIMTKEEAQNSTLRHVLTRNLGSSQELDVDIYEIEPSDNDRFLLCTDGLTDLVSDEEILGIAQRGDDPEEICRELVEMTLKRGARDNTTVVTLFFSDVGGRRQGKIGSKLGYFFSDLLTGARKLTNP